MKPPYFILDENHNAVPCFDTLEWGRFFQNIDARRVAADEIGEVTISTVFLGFDHRFFDEGPPLLFETMIFGGEFDGEQRRCSTWAEAVEQHNALVAGLKFRMN